MAALIAVSAAVLMRVALLGLSDSVGATQPFFPAIVLVALYAGWQWGLVPIIGGAAFGWWLWGGRFGEALSEDEVASMVIFLISAAITLVVAEALRGAMHSLTQARRERQDAQVRLELVQTAASVGPWEWDIVTDRLHLSASARRNLGLPLDEPVDWPRMNATFHPDDRQMVLDSIRASVRQGGPCEVEFRLADLSQGERWIHARGEVLQNAAGRSVQMLGLNFDVTSRRRDDERLRESEARFRSLADSAPALMWVSRIDGQREFVNKAYADFAGIDYEAALNLDWRTRLDPHDLPGILKGQISGEGSRKPFSLEGRYRRGDGQMRWLKSFSQPRLDPGGGFDGFIGIAFDITDAKQAEADLAGVNELLAERVQAAVAERDAAQAALFQSQKLEAIGQLTGGVAHDFNNLLTVIIGALDVVDRNPDDEARRQRMIAAAMAAARRGEKLTQHLLAFARRQPLRPEVCRIDRLIAESEGLLRRALGDAYGFHLRLGGGVRNALVDSGQFEAALLNLVVNARDATPAGGEVTIETRPVTLTQAVGDVGPGQYLRVAVRDTGSGMDAETAARAIEPFFTTKPPGEGTGLGLSQAYGFARQSGGSVDIETRPGQGATVAMLLPIAEAADLDAHEAAIDHVAGQIPSRVLLVEDDPQVAELVDAMLQDLGHTVIRAGGVDDALERLEQDAAIDLVLSDVIMPGGRSGVDLAEHLATARPGLPVVLCSGYTGGEQGRAQAGAWPFLSKPFSLDGLARVLSAARAGRDLPSAPI
ncbi:PAS domain S-box protein [Caulobacter sp. ErkDOM-YI]|uniref:hybrid sensor histidine kinase/response regulator n=1 Tax=unclassified Caulobacter TaxID=2648921 RepID=UPI003AF9F1D4